MSRPTHVERCRQWIEEQIEVMGTLRTANSRDLTFKNWRQNTVTVLQRIWPEDRERVERFRRITFTPPHTRADGKQIREWFGKGIGESRTYLQGLLEVVDREGVPHTTDEDRPHDAKEMEDEVAFPFIDLNLRDGVGAVEAAAAEEAGPTGELGVTAGYGSADDTTASRDESSPAPPSLQQTARPAATSDRHDSSQAPPALGEAPEMPAAPQGRSSHSVVAIPRVPGAASSNPAPEAAEAPVEASEPVKASQGRATEPPSLEVEAPRAAEAAKPAQQPEQGSQRQQQRGKGKQKARKTAMLPRPKLRDMLGFDQFEQRTQSAQPDPAPEKPAPAPVAEEKPVAKAEPVAEVKPVAKPEPVAITPPPAPAKPQHVEPYPELEEHEVDEATLERARMDFMQNSPVFGVVGKPVQRKTDSTEYLDPDAVAVASLVVDLGKFGVPENMKSSIAARLIEVARHLEDGTLDWALLRGVVTDAMQYPELAKRLVPVLLPWLERAA